MAQSTPNTRLTRWSEAERRVRRAWEALYSAQRELEIAHEALAANDEHAPCNHSGEHVENVEAYFHDLGA